ncbi:MAG: hypothetical protein KKF44_09570 [Nanoarchaeota archaeon]|nr:hypothetical protein [Nanoarchaeota archaeon]
MKKALLYIFIACMLSVFALAAPILTAIGDKSVNEGETLQFTVTASLPDDGTTTFVVASGPGTITKNSDVSAIYTYTPGFTESGDHFVEITATDGNSSDSESFKVTVANVGQTGMTVEEVFFGGEDQRRITTVTKTFRIKNTGDALISGINLATNADSKFRLNFTGVPTSLVAGGEAIVTAKAFVPEDLDAVDDDGTRIVHSFATMTVTGTSNAQGVSAQAALKMQAENLLVIKKLYVAGDSVSDGDDVNEEIKPNDDIDVLLRIENQFPTSGDCEDESRDCDINDIEANVQVDDLDVDEDFNFGDLNSDDTDEDTVTFSIESDADDGNYDLYVYVIGEDDNGALHGERREVTFEITKESHEITITNYEFSPTTLDCDETYVSVEVTLENTGKKDESKVTLDIVQDKLDILETVNRIDLDSGDDIRKTFSINLPKDTKPGSYYFDIIAFYDDDEETDRVSEKITVRECSTAPATPVDNYPDYPDDTTSGDVVVEYIPPTQDVIYGQPGRTEDIVKTPSSNMYVLLLVLGIIIVIVLILILFAMLLKK